VACLSNLRQLSLAFPMYSAENHSWLPVGSGYAAGDSPAGWTNPTWAGVACKMLQIPFVTERSNFVSQGYGTSYSIHSTNRHNGIFKCPSEHFINMWNGEHSTSYRHNSGYDYGYGYGMSDQYTHTSPLKWGRVSEMMVDYPATTFVIGEDRQIRDSPTSCYEYKITQFRFTTDAGDWHNGSGNYLWGDGHASSVKPANLEKRFFQRDQP
jgi:prepilin-type processing-associated H-X9-DG protein